MRGLGCVSQAILGIDPGSDKCGVAVVDLGGTCHCREVVPTPDVVPVVQRLSTAYPVVRIVIGDGTGSEALIQALREANVLSRLGEPAVVDEAYSTEEARRNYLLEHRKGWRRLIPLGLQSPREPVDGYVAEVLARRYLREQRTGQGGGMGK